MDPFSFNVPFVDLNLGWIWTHILPTIVIVERLEELEVFDFNQTLMCRSAIVRNTTVLADKYCRYEYDRDTCPTS